MVKTVLSIQGMACGMCEAHINDVIRREVPGARKVKSSYKTGECSFESDPAPDAEALRRAIAATGYEMTGLRAETVEKKRLFGRK